MNVHVLLQKALSGIGADGLCNPEEACGCGIDDLAPCENINLDECQAAKWVIPNPGEAEYENEDYRYGYYKVVE